MVARQGRKRRREKRGGGGGGMINLWLLFMCAHCFPLNVNGQRQKIKTGKERKHSWNSAVKTTKSQPHMCNLDLGLNS